MGANKTALLFLLTMTIMAFKSWSGGGGFIFAFPLTTPFVAITIFYLLIYSKANRNEILFFVPFAILHFATSPIFLEIIISGETQRSFVQSPWFDLTLLALVIYYFSFGIRLGLRMKNSYPKAMTIFGSCLFLIGSITLPYEMRLVGFGLISLGQLIESKWTPYEQIWYILFLGSAMEYYHLFLS